MNKYFLLFILLIILLLSNDLFITKENNTNITFIHIPKNAGTSIEYIGYNNGYKWGKYFFYDIYLAYLLDKIIIYYKTNYHSYFLLQILNLLNTLFDAKHHNPYFYKTNKRLLQNKVSFMVIRNPYTKMISNYKFLNHDKNEINEFIKKNIENLNKNIKKKNMYYFVPQHEFLMNNTEVLKFENLNEDFKNFCLKYDLKKMVLPKINISNNKYKITIKDLNNESINLINEFYSKDFELFNYKKINPI